MFCFSKQLTLKVRKGKDLSHPYLFVLMQLFSNLQIKNNTCIPDIQVFYFALIAHLILVDLARELR